MVSSTSSMLSPSTLSTPSSSLTGWWPFRFLSFRFSPENFKILGYKSCIFLFRLLLLRSTFHSWGFYWLGFREMGLHLTIITSEPLRPPCHRIKINNDQIKEKSYSLLKTSGFGRLRLVYDGAYYHILIEGNKFRSAVSLW